MEKLTDISDCLKIDDKIEEVDGKNIFDFLFKTGTFKEIKDAIVSLEEDGYIETIGFTRSMPAENKFKVTTHSKE